MCRKISEIYPSIFASRCVFIAQKKKKKSILSIVQKIFRSLFLIIGRWNRPYGCNFSR